VRSHIAALLFLALSPTVAGAQEPKTGVISGTVTTQGTVRLPGADVVVRDGAGKQVAEILSGEDGHFNVVGLQAGKYKVSASLASFVMTTMAAEVVTGRSTDITIDLPIEGIAATVEVVATNPVVSSEGTLAPTETISGKEIDQFASSGGVQASLRLLASVIQAPNGVSIRGGRPSQAGVQLGPNTMVDPSTGLSKVSLPDDAIESVSVLPNPYAVEFGRFSSGVVVIQTRRAGDEWKMRINDIDPTFRTHRGSPVDVIGLGWYAPRVEFGGPLIKSRLFLEQAAQFRYQASDVPSLPETLLHTSTSFSSFTRVDANLSSRHTLVATLGLFPGRTHEDLLGTFMPPDATVDTHVHANEIAVTERALWTDALFGETTVHVHHYQTDVSPQGLAPMQLQPDTTLGNFFNEQHRDTDSYQLIESLSGSHTGKGGSHLFKVGIDLLRNAYDGSSLSRSVLVERADGTLARSLAFPAGPTAQRVHTTDVALFAQDRYQPNARWYVEFGGRIDRDGVVDRFNVTPRVGTAVLVNKSGSAVLRGGFGLFYERTPSMAGAFNEFGTVIDQRYGGDGVTPLGPAIAFVPTTAELQTPRSRTWDLGFDHRLNKLWAIHFGMLDRQGSHELIVNPLQTGAAGELQLSSDGRSSYLGGEAGLHFTYNTRADLNVSYTRSSAHADLNALSNYFDTIMWPVFGANAYAPAPADAPNRVLARGRFMPTLKWLVIGIFDWRNGLPYSVTNESLDFVGPRNALRFPNYLRLEVGLEHRFTIARFQPWIGVRVWNALQSFLPTDVQANLNSHAFGSFYNSEYRQVRIILRFER
jgi:carboxypeptidase family protein/TonB-dependent receptor-like protein